MLRAYLDGSYSNDGAVAVVAGVVAQEEKWAEFLLRWRALLDEFGIRRFHAAEYWDRRGQFHRMSDADLLKLKGDIVSIFKYVKPYAIGAIVYGDAYKQWRMQSKSFLNEDPHYYALSYALDFLIARLNTYPVDDGIEIICDQDKERQKLSAEMATWHTERLRRFQERAPGHPEPQRNVQFSYRSSFDVLQLQAADIIAHSALRWGLEDLKSGKTDLPPFLAAISPECPIGIQPFWNADIIRMHEEATWR